MSESLVLPDLSQVLYTQEGMDKAAKYLQTRGLDASKMLHPVTVGPSIPRKLKPFEDRMAMPFAKQMVDRLYLPVVDPLDSTGKKLIGFDCRYIGSKGKDFVRWIKIKEPSRNATQFTYGFREAAYNLHKPTVLVESILCAETIRQNFSDIVNAVSFCSAMRGIKAASLLSGLSDKIILAYDNDSGGMGATQDLMERVSALDGVKFVPLMYQGQDINSAFINYGAQPLRDSLESAVTKFSQSGGTVSFSVGQIG